MVFESSHMEGYNPETQVTLHNGDDRMYPLTDVPVGQIDRLMEVMLNDREPESYIKQLAEIVEGSKNFGELVNGMEGVAAARGALGSGKGLASVARLAFNVGWRCRDLLNSPGAEARKMVLPVVLLGSDKLDELLLLVCREPEPESKVNAISEMLAASESFMVVVAGARETYRWDGKIMDSVIVAMMTFFQIGWKCRDTAEDAAYEFIKPERFNRR